MFVSDITDSAEKILGKRRETNRERCISCETWDLVDERTRTNTAQDQAIKGALYRIQILCRWYTFWSYPTGLTIADPPG